jgi:hypothetical protein
MSICGSKPPGSPVATTWSKHSITF